MPLIVDTYNVVHTTGVLPPDIAGIDAAALIVLIRSSRYRHDRVTLVCDGVPGEDAPTGRVGPVVIRYSGGESTADEVIARMIGRSSIPRKLTVVSSDRAVLREARRRRCATLRSEEFLHRLAEDHETAASRKSRKTGRPAPPGPLPPGEIGQWMEEFDLAGTEFLPPPVAPGEGDMAEAAERLKPPADEETSPAPPGAPAFPAELLAEAEAILRAGIPDDPPAAPAPAEPDQTSPAQEEPPADVADEDPTPPAEAPPPRQDLLRAVLPESMIDEAETLVAESNAADAAAPEPEDAAVPSDRQEDGEQAEPGESAPAPDPGRAVLPAELIAQAEAIEQASRGEEPPSTSGDVPPDAGPVPARDVPGDAGPVAAMPEDILPPDVLAEAESLLRDEEYEHGEDEPPEEDEDDRRGH